MSDWEITIRRADNGFITSWEEETEDGHKKHEAVFAFDEDKEDESKENREVIQNLLYHITDYFGETGSKHDPYRIRIEVVKQ